ncbi:hypothetical protein N1851_026973 [Merluccius polli]|uniref:Uncharacterized protein n=1 Tax=Merluccius polli TaxID=89951 RepID=A0AA47MAS4_MERPO|nr:hypothetical protein N1851_026973 [Merluccius polli]
MDKLIKPAEPIIPFGAVEPSWQEVNNFLKKARGKSAPGINGILYKVGWLLKGSFIPKEENSTEIKQFCTISLLNVEGKICFRILDTSVISKIIEDAKRNHGDLTALWLNLINA